MKGILWAFSQLTEPTRVNAALKRANRALRASLAQLSAVPLGLVIVILAACSGGDSADTTNTPTVGASTRASATSSLTARPASPTPEATAAATATAVPATEVPPTAYPVRTDNGIIGEDFIAKCSASYGQPGILRSANQCQCAWDRLSEEYDQITLSNINWNGLDGDYYMDKVKDDCPAGA